MNTCASRAVFIDCGSNTGAVLRDHIVRGHEREFVAFEPQPELRSVGDRLRQEFPQTPLSVFEKAVWTVDGRCPLFLATAWGENYRGGSTVVPGHVNNAAMVDYDHPFLVECIDFSAWLMRTYRPDDRIVVKMDIEGAEYAVLDKMIVDGSIDYVDELIVEFHWAMNPSLGGQAMHDALLRRLLPRTRVVEWH